MRILASVFHPKGLWPYSGSERRFCALTREWAVAGAETWGLEPEPVAGRKMDAGYRPIIVPVRGVGLGQQLLSWYLDAVPRGLQAAQESAFDLVYATNNNVFNLLVAVTLSRRLSLPCVAVVHHLRWVDYAEVPRRYSMARLDPLHFLSALGREGLSIGGAATRVAGALLETRLLHALDGFITVSRAVEGQLVDSFAAESVYTTGNALSEPRGKVTHVDRRDRAALYVGRLDEGKGALELVSVWQRVLRRCPDARIEIVGGGSLLPRVEAAAIAASLMNRFRLHGFLNDTATDRVRATSRLFVTLSRTEGFGIAIAEALDAGLPVVAWDIPPLREIWGSCPAISLCPTGNIEAAAEAIVELLELPEDRWNTLSREASSFVRRFSWAVVAEKELRALQEIAGAC